MRRPSVHTLIVAAHAMRRDEVLACLKAAEPEMRAFSVGTLYLFGSIARDEADEGSDIDLFGEPCTATLCHLKNDMAAYRRLMRSLPGVNIVHSTREGLSQHVWPSVDRETIRVF